MLKFIGKIYKFSERTLYDSECCTISDKNVVEIQNKKFTKDLTYECRPKNQKYDNNLTWSQKNGRIIIIMHDLSKHLMPSEIFVGNMFEENGEIYLKGKFKLILGDFIQMAFIFSIFLYPILGVIIIISEGGFSHISDITDMMIFVVVMIAGPAFGVMMIGFTGVLKILNSYRRRNFLRELWNSLQHISIAS